MRVLVIDASPISRRFIRQDLSAAGYAVVEAADGESALSRFSEHLPHLITLSLADDARTGYSVCHAIRAAEAERCRQNGVESLVPIVFVTGDDSAAHRDEAFAAGATDFLDKPFPAGALGRKVNAILRPRRVWVGIRALVADDSLIVRSIVVRALRDLGVEVLEAADGRAALDLLESRTSEIDMVISDLHMPGMDGAELCRRARAMPQLAEAPFIVLSASGERSSILQLFRAGATDYLVKPFYIEELLARVRVQLNTLLLLGDLAEQNRRGEADMVLARNVQRAALHSDIAAQHARTAVCYRPLDQVSGDVYDFSLGAAGDLNVFLGDATGHGTGAALMTMMVQTALDSVGPECAVDETMSRLDGLIRERADEQFVTGVYARLAPDGCLTWTSAGHPPPILVPRVGSAELLTSEGGLPLGMAAFGIPFGRASRPLAAGDRVFLYSDGISERGRADGEQFGTERLLAYLTDRRGDPLDEVVQGAAVEAETFAAGEPSQDDLTLVGVEYAP